MKQEADKTTTTVDSTAKMSSSTSLASSVASATASSADVDVDTSKYWWSISALCMISLSQSWLLISVFPYSGFMAIDLIPGVDEENAGSYAGLLASAFMVGRALTSYAWGKAADVYGRLFVLRISLLFCSICSIFFGLSSSFGMALFWLFLMGFSNGVFGTSKTCVSELAHGNEKLETQGMTMSMGMWAWGFLLSPALSGLLSEPVKSYPNSTIVQQFSRILSRHPFILPNLVSVLLCLGAIAGVSAFVPETLPAKNMRNPRWIVCDIIGSVSSKFSGCFKTSRTSETKSLTKGTSLSHYGTNGTIYDDIERPSAASEDHDEIPPEATMSSLWANHDTRNHLIVNWLFSFIIVAVDEGFPLFCISREGGLGLSEVDIGTILSMGV